VKYKSLHDQYASNKKAKKIGRAVANTATLGFGFSLGRDIYKRFKSSFSSLLLLLIVLTILLFPFLAASKSFRWYPLSSLKWFFSIFLPWTLGAIIITLSPYYIFYLFGDWNNFSTYINAEILSEIDNYNGYKINILHYQALYFFVIYTFGILHSLFLRSKRKVNYIIEKHNNNFLYSIGIQEIDGASTYTHIDQNGNQLRLVNIGKDVIEFFVVGKRGRRAFIYLDEDEKYKNYSGIVKV